MPDRVGSRNGYAYVEGNPVNRTDPSGECWWNDDEDTDLREFCFAVWSDYLNEIDAIYKNWSDKATDRDRHLAEHIRCQANLWSALTAEDFILLWLEDSFIPCQGTLSPFGAYMSSAQLTAIDPLSILAAGGIAIAACVAQSLQQATNPLLSSSSGWILPTRPKTHLIKSAEEAEEKLDTLLGDALDDSHLDAARRERRGERVATRGDGKPYDHVKEVKDARKGLKGLIKGLKGRINHGEYHPDDVSASEMEKLKKLLDRAEQRLHDVNDVVGE